jgi:hypothetical protein
MLRNAGDIIGWTAMAQDGPVGVVRDLLVDDRQWSVRHLTVETSSLARERHVLLSPRAVKRLNAERERFELSLRQWQAAGAPEIEFDPPIQVQQEQLSYDAFGWRYYWRRPAGSMEGQPAARTRRPADPPAPRSRDQREADPHLRSIVVMTGYHVVGADGAIGVVEDFVLDDETWRIGCLVVGYEAAKVAVPVRHIAALDWATSEMTLDLAKAQVIGADAYNAESPGCGELAA